MEKEERNELIEILASIGLLIVLIVMEHTGAMESIFGGSIIRMVPFLILWIVSGREVITGAVKGILKRELLDEEFLMTIATIGAFVTGEYAEGVAVMLFYRLGEWFQDHALDKSRDSIKDLMDLAPDTASRIDKDGHIEEVKPEEIMTGDRILVKTGDKVPVDGIVIKGESSLDTAALTGEPVPRTCEPGDQLISGCIALGPAITMEATKVFQDSTVSRIMELVENAQEKKSRTEKFITRFANVYTPVVVIAALLLAVVSPILGFGSFLKWIYRACTFLVISCPCAIVLSVPLAFFGGIGAASKRGVLVKGSNYLEQMASLDTLVTDKTGTITKGEFKVTRAASFDDGEDSGEMIRLAAVAESTSNHPIAKAILDSHGEMIDTGLLESHEDVKGKGVRAVIDGKNVLVGKRSFLLEEGIADVPEGDMRPGKTAVYVAVDGKAKGFIEISDTVKEEVAGTIKELKTLGVKNIVMLTGDREEAAKAVAEEAGVDSYYSDLLPENKVSRIEEVEGDVVAFVGDGINDAPVLMRSDVGIAMGSMGSDAAIEASDIVIMDDDLGKIPKLIKIAKDTVGIAKMDIVFALGVKFLILALGAFGIANMWAAVFADVGVAVLCILNSMRMLAK